MKAKKHEPMHPQHVRKRKRDGGEERRRY